MVESWKKINIWKENLVGLSKILISQPSAQKERFRENKISQISKCIEKNEHAMYHKKFFYVAILIKDDTWLVECGWSNFPKLNSNYFDSTK